MGEAVAATSSRWIAGSIIALIVVASLVLWARQAAELARRDHDGGPARTALRLGLPDSPLLAVAYQARDPGWAVVRTKSASDVGYALLAGTIDAGFVEAAKAKILLEGTGPDRLRIIGAVTFPYGSTVVGRKGVVTRLEDLAGRTVAASSAGCALLAQFTTDARARGLDPAAFTVASLPFDAMVPALEAGTVDAAVLRGAQSLVAARAGHPVVYQNWRMQAGDECCPPVLAQTEYLLLARDDRPGLEGLAAALSAANEAKPSELRHAAAIATGFPEELLAGFPVASFILPDPQTLAAYGHHHHD